MGIFSRIWGRGYNNRVSLLLLANAICIVLLIPKLMPVPFMDKIVMSYLALTFLLLNKRYKLITIIVFEFVGAFKLFYSYIQYEPWTRTVLRNFFEDLIYGSGIIASSDIIARAFINALYWSAFIAYSCAILVIFFITSIMIDWRFKIRKRAGLN